MAERPDSGDQKIWDEALNWIFRLDRAGDDAALQAALDAWRRADPRHDQAFAQADLIWRAAPAMTPALASKWRGLSARPRLAPRRGLMAMAALAAGVALFLVSGGWLALTTDYRTASGEQRTVQLPDGSQLRLNSDSAVRLAFAGGRRDVQLVRGEAFFDVVPDESRPFTVTAGQAWVRVVGTHFDVRLTRPGVSVEVEEGRVAVGLRSQDARPDSSSGILLAAGEAARLNFAERQVTEIALPAGHPVAAWRTGRLVVERWTVAQVLDEIGRYYGGHILLRDPVLAGKMVNGVYDISRPAAAVQAVAEASGARVTSITPYLLVVSPN